VKRDENTQHLMKGLQSSSSLTPHPISVFLSNFAGASNNNMAKCASSRPVGARQRSQIPQQNAPRSVTSTTNEEQITHCNISRNDDKVNAPLKPVKAPPVWLDIRVKCISNLSIGAINGKLGSLQLCMSCNEPILSVGKLTHSHSDSNIGTKSLSLGSEKRSQDILKLRTGRSNVFSSKTVCSWQVALDAKRKGDKNTAVTLHIWHCSNNSDESPPDVEAKILVGVVSFNFEPTNDSQKKDV
jgi:hypothetical protein